MLAHVRRPGHQYMGTERAGSKTKQLRRAAGRKSCFTMECGVLPCKCDVRIEVVDDQIGEICYQTAGSWSGHLLAAQCGPWCRRSMSRQISMLLGASNHSPQTQIPGVTAMAHAWHTHGRPAPLLGWSSQSFLWTLSIVSISRGDMQATLNQLQVQPYLLPHRRIGCKLGCSSGETKNGHCALHFPAFLHFSGQRRQPLQAARLLIQLATRDGRPPGPTLGDLRPVQRFTASPQESADGLLGACDPLCRFLPVSSRQADGADGADEADGAPWCYDADLTRPARYKRRHALLDRRSCIIASCLSRPIDHLDWLAQVS